MEKQITINVPEGKELVQSTDKGGNITIKFVDKEPIRSKSWEEFCKNHPIVTENEYYFCDDSSIRSTQNRKYDKTPRRYIEKLFLSSREDAEGILALIQLTRLHDEWVGDWKPNWEDNKNFKFGIYVHNNIIDIFTLTVSHRLLVFPSFSMAKEFLKCFIDLLEKAKRYI